MRRFSPWTPSPRGAVPSRALILGCGGCFTFGKAASAQRYVSFVPADLHLFAEAYLLSDFVYAGVHCGFFSAMADRLDFLYVVGPSKKVLATLE